MFLLTEEDVCGSCNKATNAYVREEVVLLQSHVWQTEVPLEKKERGNTKEKGTRGEERDI